MSEPTSSMDDQGPEARIRELEQRLQATEKSLDKRFEELAKLTRSLEEERAQKEALQQQLSELRKQVARAEQEAEQPAPAVVVELTEDERARQLDYRQLVSQSELFDGEWYLATYPDLQHVERYRQAPQDHYLLFGGFEGRDPGPQFDSSFYLEQYPDVASSKMNPLAHYLLYGRDEQRQIQPAQG